jgi:hypothetical protein
LITVNIPENGVPARLSDWTLIIAEVAVEVVVVVV